MTYFGKSVRFLNIKLPNNLAIPYKELHKPCVPCMKWELINMELPYKCIKTFIEHKDNYSAIKEITLIYFRVRVNKYPINVPEYLHKIQSY